MDPDRMVLLRRTLSVVALTLCLAGVAPAQETRGTILGDVRDTSGGALPGITVMVTNQETHALNEVVTNARGSFEIPYLLPGTYQIEVQAQGFKQVAPP